MQIKKFNQLNESHVIDSEHSYIKGENIDILTESDFKKLHRSGRKAFIVNKDFELVEIKSKSDIRNMKHKRNPNFQDVVFMSDESKGKLVDMVKNIGEIEELYKKKMELLFQYIIATAQKEWKDKEES